MEAILTESPDYFTEKFHSLLAVHFPAVAFARLSQLDVFGLVQYLVYHFHLNENRDGYLRFFLDTVLEFIRKHRGGLAEFLEWWEEKSLTASVIMPEGINAVKIMTIHKAKGLQFPVVIYPFADDRIRPVRKKLWVNIEESFAEPLKTVCVPANKSLGETVYKQVYEDEMNRSAADMANVLYVALTRPEERLYVIMKEFPDSIEGALTVNKLFSRFFKEEGNWETNRETYQYGERWQQTCREISREETREKESPESRESLQLLLRRHAPLAWDMENPEKNREWGNLVHTVFSHIRKPDELAGLLHKLIIDGVISTDQQQEISLLLDGILSDPQISALFDPGFEIRNEPEIMTKDGHFFRPDRVMIKNGKVSILDYKTGKPKEEHRSQVMQYASLIREMDLAVDSAYLLYLNREPQLVKLI
jgi:ATP-dependent exoDNAse (exonuclease V) beta subunit